MIHNFWQLGPSGVKGTVNILKIDICLQPVTDARSAWLKLWDFSEMPHILPGQQGGL